MTTDQEMMAELGKLILSTIDTEMKNHNIVQQAMWQAKRNQLIEILQEKSNDRTTIATVRSYCKKHAKK